MTSYDAPFDPQVVLEETRQVAPLSRTAVQLAAECAHPHADLRRMAAIVETDRQVAPLVRASASAALPADRDGVGTREAVVLLGAGNVLAIVLAVQLRTWMSSPVPSYDLRQGELWGHAVMSAAAADSLGALAGVDVPPVAGAAALVHDVGKLVLGPHLRPAHLRALREAERRRDGALGRIAVERQVLEVDTDFLAGLVGLTWGLPRNVVDAVTHTHDPEGRGALAHVVCLANRAAHHIGRRRGTDAPGLAASLEALGLSLADWPDVLAHAERRVQQMAHRYQALAVPDRPVTRRAR